ncbi:hypothetical protein D3C86_1385640 [compost metagenome]
MIQLLGRQERVPDGPGIDTAVGECRAAIRCFEVTRGDVGKGQSGFLQRRNQQEVAARALGHRDRLALQISNTADRRGVRNDDRLGAGRWILPGVIGQWRIGRLGKQGKGVGDVGMQIDTAGVQGAEQAGTEFMPVDGKAEGFEALLQLAVLLEQNPQGRGTLVADIDGLLSLGPGCGEQQAGGDDEFFQLHERPWSGLVRRGQAKNRVSRVASSEVSRESHKVFLLY